MGVPGLAAWPPPLARAWQLWAGLLSCPVLADVRITNALETSVLPIWGQEPLCLQGGPACGPEGEPWQPGGLRAGREAPGHMGWGRPVGWAGRGQLVSFGCGHTRASKSPRTDPWAGPGLDIQLRANRPPGCHEQAPQGLDHRDLSPAVPQAPGPGFLPGLWRPLASWCCLRCSSASFTWPPRVQVPSLRHSHWRRGHSTPVTHLIHLQPPYFQKKWRS